MIQIRQKKQCTGCGACKDVCPVNCIQLQPDEEGFLYPQVAAEKCIGCGKCERVCPVTKSRQDTWNGAAYAARNRDSQIRQDSSSGGVFTELARSILEKGGAVFGAAMDENLRVKHICVERMEELPSLRGSKYVQSQIGQCYRQAKQLLENGRLVLFTGTPCQIGGLYSFLGKDYENLYSQDIICHGVPSPWVWGQYVKYRERKAGAKAQSVYFRSKIHGWRTFSICFKFVNGKSYEKRLSEDPFMQSFLSDLCLRPSCYDCAFKSRSRDADITLADFWGVEKCVPQLDDDKGTSLVLLHSEKGRELFDRVRDRLEIEQTDFEKAISFNSAMLKSVALKPEREAFMNCLRQRGFDTAARRYLKIPVMLRVKRKIKNILKRIRRK